jgi:hypothetical protein
MYKWKSSQNTVDISLLLAMKIKKKTAVGKTVSTRITGTWTRNKI